MHEDPSSADWRTAFSNESTNSWERRLEERLDAGGSGAAVPVVRAFRLAWRKDCRSDEAVRLEAAFLSELSGSTLASGGAVSTPARLSLQEVDGVREMIRVTRLQLAESGLQRLRVFRGVAFPELFRVGDTIESLNRGLSSWAADAAVAEAFAARKSRSRREHGILLEATVPVEDVAMLFDPSSDGEVVVIGDVMSTVMKVI